MQDAETVRCGELEDAFGVGLGAAAELRFGLDGEEDGDAGEQQRLRQALDDGVDESAEVGLGVEGAAEVDEGLAVVEAAAIEETVDARLNDALERIEDALSSTHRRFQSGTAQTLVKPQIFGWQDDPLALST